MKRKVTLVLDFTDDYQSGPCDVTMSLTADPAWKPEEECLSAAMAEMIMAAVRKVIDLSSAEVSYDSEE